MGLSQTPLLSMRGIRKRFAGVVALEGVKLEVAQGEVVGLCGENGAGKSTLMKILGGVHQPDAGKITFKGTEVRVESVTRAMRLGIAFIHQELNLLDNLDVAANVLFAREPLSRLGLINEKKAHASVQPLLRRLGLDVSSRTRVDKLSIAQKQMVEIAKALSAEAQVIIMDEPTSSLTVAETDRLLQLVQELSKQGVSIIYISHRLAEVERCAHRVVVLRDGRNAGVLARSEIAHDRIVNLMVGREIKTCPIECRPCEDRAFFEVRNMRSTRYPAKRVSFDVAQGEILGLAGLAGSGRSEIAKAIFGLDDGATGELALAGQRLSIRSARDAIAQGICLMPEDRRGEGLILDMNVRENVTLPLLQRFGVLLHRDRERETATGQMMALRIKARDCETLVMNLSGGNQQKVVLAKWLAMKPKVMILDEPTRGVDVGAKAEIHRLMRALADQGTAVVMISSDMEEILRVSDRVMVMHEGEIAGLLRRDNCTEQNIMHLAVGQRVSCVEAPYAN